MNPDVGVKTFVSGDSFDVQKYTNNAAKNNPLPLLFLFVPDLQILDEDELKMTCAMTYLFLKDEKVEAIEDYFGTNLEVIRNIEKKLKELDKKGIFRFRRFDNILAEPSATAKQGVLFVEFDIIIKTI